jgi:hypothetical protein
MGEDKKPLTDEEFEVVIRHNVKTGVSGLLGCDKNPLVAIGMMEWALGRVKRHVAQNEMIEEMSKVPRIQVAERLVS